MFSLDYVMLFQIITFQRYKMTLEFFRGFNFKSLKNKSFNSIKKVLTCTRDISLPILTSYGTSCDVITTHAGAC